MDNVETMIERFVACWNEPDADVRRRVIDELWVEDGTYRNASTEFAGVRRVEEAVGQAYEAFGANGFVFTLASVDTNHDAVRYRWEMVPATGGPPDSIGTHVAMIGADGRFVSDHQFIDKPPTGR